MAEVWRAVHLGQGIPVAVKVMIGDKVRDPFFQEAFQTEARAIARLHHPSIVTVLDFGLVSREAHLASEGQLMAGSPYLAMEYVSGGTLARIRGPLPFGAILEVLLPLLDALAHAHARGVLHRDLKPVNVLIGGRSDLRRGLKLTDFGIAHPLEQEREPDRERESSGTPQFMAPEQFFGRWRDYGPWTDLYALGCIAYSLATGRLPFDGRVFTQLAMQHIKDPVPEPACAHPMPDGFGTWIQRLLEKNPRERFQRAADASFALMTVAQTVSVELGGAFLEEHDGEASATATVVETTADDAATLPWAAKTLTTDAWRELRQVRAQRPDSKRTIHRIPPLPGSWRREASVQPPRLAGAGLGLYGLRPVPLVDRDRERDAIWDALARARQSGRATLIELTGPAGNGKTRIAEWMSQRAHELGAATVLRASHGPSLGPGHGIAAMIARHLRCFGLSRADTEERIEDLLKGFGETSPHEWRALTELIHPSDRDASAAGSAQVIRLVSATERHVVARRLVERLAVERPVIVWLDDVHWGSDALAFVLHVLDAQAESPAPITFVLISRDDLLAEQPVEADLLAKVRSRDTSATVHLPRLGRADHRALVADLLGLEASLAERVADRTDGNPLFAIQLVGDWVQRGVLSLTDAGFVVEPGHEVPFPDDLHAVWSDRVEALAGGDEGAEVALEIAAALGGDFDASEWGALCAEAGVSVPERVVEELLKRRLLGRTGGILSFAHGMLRESLARSAAEAGRSARHHGACADLLSRRGEPTPERSERIARHLLAAGRPAEALGPLMHRIRSHLDTGEYAEADDLLGAYAGTLDAAAVPAADPRRPEHLVLRARTFTRRGDFERARALVDGAEAAARAHHHRTVLGEIAWERGSIAYEQNDQGTALERFEEARRLFEFGDERGVAKCFSSIGDCRYRLGNLEGAAHRYRDALEMFTRSNDTAGCLGCLWGLGYVELWKGQLSRARESFERQHAMAEASGNRHHMARALNAMGEVARMERAFDAAEDHYRRAGRLFVAVGSPEVDMCDLNLGLIYVGRGDFTRALDHAQSIWARILRTGDRLKLCYVHMQMLPALAAGREWVVFDKHIETVVDLVADLRVHDGDVAETFLITGGAALAAGDRGRARRAYEIALGQWRGLRRDEKVRETEERLADL
jgi:tetratricopeptide (TPR) repeat protein